LSRAGLMIPSAKAELMRPTGVGSNALLADDWTELTCAGWRKVFIKNVGHGFLVSRTVSSVRRSKAILSNARY
jgi:hypothetical protein